MQRALILQRGLLACGFLASLLYVVTDIIGALHYPGYDYAAQAISEMSAIGAPTTKLLAPYYQTFSVLFLAFTVGVWLSGRSRGPLRLSAAFLFGVIVVGTGFSIYPMNMRGVERTFSDTMHLVIGGVTMLLLSGAILTGGSAFGGAFRRYSIATVTGMLLFFVLTLFDAPKVAANLPTPYMGLNERICMAAWLLWVAVLSIQLLRGAQDR